MTSRARRQRRGIEVTLPLDLHEALTALRTSRGTPASAVVEHALRVFLGLPDPDATAERFFEKEIL
jgi:hypothetical protein